MSEKKKHWKNQDDDDENATLKPIVVHIAGASGSGKSHLGELLAKRYGERIAVKDTDEFYQHGTPEGDRLDALINNQDEYLRVWLQMRRDAIDKFIAANRGKRAIVFVGLLNHMAPRERQVPLTMEQADLRFYIKISAEDLLRQYYTRVLKFADANPRLWAEIIAGKDRIDSSDEKQKENRELRQAHKAARYVVGEQDEILAHFATLFASPKEEIMLVASMDDKEEHVEPDSEFLLRYSTSAISWSKFAFSSGLRVVKNDVEASELNTTPGSYIKHTMLVRVVAKKFPSTETITETITSPIPNTPAIRKVLLVYVDREPTGQENAPAPARHTPIVFDDSGYIYGVKYRIVVEEKGGKFHATYDGQYIGHRDEVFESDEIWRIADEYVKDGTFHKPTDADTRPCCDIGSLKVHYRDMVADGNSVWRLMAIATRWFGKLN